MKVFYLLLSFCVHVLVAIFPAFCVATEPSGLSTTPRHWADCEFLLKSERWNIDGPASNYEMDFSPLLEKLNVRRSKLATYFDVWIRTRQAEGKQVHVLDLFGSGFFTSAADSMTGLRYGPIELYSSEIERGVNVPPQVYGDIFQPSTWTALDQSLKDRGMSGFDLVLMNPVGGWFGFESTRDEANKFAYIVRQVLLRLNPNGQFYFRVTSTFFNSTRFRKPLSSLFKRELTDKGFELICESAGNSLACVARPINPGVLYRKTSIAVQGQ